MLQIVKGDLAGSSSFANGRVGQRAAFSQGEDARRKADFAHGHRDEVGRTANQTQEAETVADSVGMGGNFEGVGLRDARQNGWTSVAQACAGSHAGRARYVRRQAKFAQGLAGQLAQRFDFQVAPGAARLAGLVQPVKLGLNASPRACRLLRGGDRWRGRLCRAACSFSASGGSGRRSESLRSQSRRSSMVGVSRSPDPDQIGHFRSRGGCRDRADAPDAHPKQTFPHAWLLAMLLKIRLASMPVSKV